jgi:hypothetical protein
MEQTSDRRRHVAVLLIGFALCAARAGAQTPPSDALRDCLDATYPDGPLKEASMRAQSLSLDRYLDALEQAQKRTPSPVVLSAVRERVEKMCAFLMCSTMPGGQLPRWGESEPPLESASLLRRGAELFHREDMRWVATRGKQGKRPANTSVAFPAAGYSVLRSGWDPMATFLALHNGRSAARGHFDANSVVLTAFGNELLIDPGSYGDSTEEARLLARTAAHNTVTMDDRNARNEAGTCRLEMGRIMDVLDSVNAGYEGGAEGQAARHRRRIVFLKPALCLIVDDATAEQPHDWTLRFRFAPGEVAYRPNTQQVTFQVAARGAHEADAQVDANAVDLAHGPGGLQLWSQDDRKPQIGSSLAASGRGNSVRTPTVSWNAAQSRTAHFATLLLPFGEAEALEQWNLRQEAGGATVAYGPTDSPVNAVVVVKPAAGVEASEKSNLSTGVETDAEVAFVQSGPAGQEGMDTGGPRRVLALAVTNARRLAWHGDPQPRAHRDGDAPGETLFLAARPVTSLEAVWRGDTVSVNVEGGEAVQIQPFRARWVVINGRKRAAVPVGGGLVPIRP